MNKANADNEEPLQIYAIRILPQAKRDIDNATMRMAEINGDAIALDWYENLYLVTMTLATLPRRCPIAPEDAFFKRQVRQLQYRRTGDSPAYRILFTITEGSNDAPTVSVIHVRHAARKPMTRKEAREIQDTD